MKISFMKLFLSLRWEDYILTQKGIGVSIFLTKSHAFSFLFIQDWDSLHWMSPSLLQIDVTSTLVQLA